MLPVSKQSSQNLSKICKKSKTSLISLKNLRLAHNHHIAHNYHFENEGKKLIKLKEDFNALTFISMKKDIIKKHKLNKGFQTRRLYGILWVWLIELRIIIILLKTLIFSNEGFSIDTPTVDVYCTRFITCLLMHMLLITDVK